VVQGYGFSRATQGRQDQAAENLRTGRNTSLPRRNLKLHAVSLLKQIVEGLPCVGRPQRLGCRGLFFDHHADGVEAAVVALVLARNPFGNGLGTFKTARGVEISTLLAGMEFEAALGTLAHWFAERFQKRSALRATRNGSRTRHLNCARAEGILLDRLTRPFGIISLLAGLTTVLIAALPVLPV
jgi:hypothetical protein